jgi:hypothetical protein
MTPDMRKHTQTEHQPDPKPKQEERERVAKQVGLIVDGLERFYLAINLGTHPNTAKGELVGLITQEKQATRLNELTLMPHESHCAAANPVTGGVCDCWKAKRRKEIIG